MKHMRQSVRPSSAVARREDRAVIGFRAPLLLLDESGTAQVGRVGSGVRPRHLIPSLRMLRSGAFATIPNQRGEILLCHRRDLDLWNSPGG